MIITNRLKIEIASDEEMRLLIEKQTDEEMKKAYGEMLAGCRAHPENRQWYAVWFIRLYNGEVVGDYCFKGLQPDGSVEIGYGLLPQYWGNGYATEAIIAAVEWAIKQPGVKRIEAETDPDNAASQRVLQKAGFFPTGAIGEEGPRFVWNGFLTERLIIRHWKESDAGSLFEYAKDPAVGPIAGWPVHTSIENSLEIIRNVLSADETYAVCLKEDNRAIGSIGLIPPQQSHTVVKETEIEVGYWIGVPFWGNGYIPEAVKRLQKHAFEDLGCTAMWCGYYDGNEKSKRCQEKCGFRYHHTEKDKPCPLMGDVRTEHFTYLSKEEWLKNE